MKPIHILANHCYYSEQSSEKFRPDWFNKRKIFENFKRTIDNSICDFTLIYDEKYGEIKSSYLWDEENVITFEGGSDTRRMRKTFEVLFNLYENKKINEDTIIYFLEDDYLHRENWCSILLEGFQLPVHYISLYDHLDKYQEMYSGLMTCILHTQSVHWKATPSTTNTFATKLKYFIEDYETHKRSCEELDGVVIDHEKFLELSKNKRILITPIPGYSTHCNEFLSPCIDWSVYL